MQAKFSPSVQEEITKIRKKDRKLYERIEKQINFFELNPFHPSLRRHKLTGKYENVWSISINMSVRMIYILIDEDTAYFIQIGKHEEVYS